MTGSRPWGRYCFREEIDDAHDKKLDLQPPEVAIITVQKYIQDLNNNLDFYTKKSAQIDEYVAYMNDRLEGAQA